MIKQIKKAALITSKWSGGTTTELYIYPEDGDYKSLDFDFRISTATVDVLESKFSVLPGINRLIMSLTKPLTLDHKNHHKMILQPFEVDEFKGDWQTVSQGKVIDFNVMFKEGYNAQMVVHYNDMTVSLQNKFGMIYAFDSELSVRVKESTFVLSKGDFLVIKDEKEVNIKSNNTPFVWVTL